MSRVGAVAPALNVPEQGPSSQRLASILASIRRLASILASIRRLASILASIPRLASILASIRRLASILASIRRLASILASIPRFAYVHRLQCRLRNPREASARQRLTALRPSAPCEPGRRDGHPSAGAATGIPHETGIACALLRRPFRVEPLSSRAAFESSPFRDEPLSRRP